MSKIHKKLETMQESMPDRKKYKQIHKCTIHLRLKTSSCHLHIFTNTNTRQTRQTLSAEGPVLSARRGKQDSYRFLQSFSEKKAENCIDVTIQISKAYCLQTVFFFIGLEASCISESFSVFNSSEENIRTILLV